MKQGDGDIQKDGESSFFHKCFVVDFQPVKIVVAASDADTREQFTTVQLHFLLSDSNLFVQYSIFRTGGNIGNLDFPLLFHFGEVIGNINLRCQGTSDVMAKIHGSKAKGIVCLTQRKFAVVELHLPFQYVILRFHAMLVGTFHVPGQFRQ